MAAVISIPDPTFQEIGITYVMGSAESSPDADAVRSSVKERLANYKVPKELFVLDELSMLPIGKVDKNALKARHAPSPSTTAPPSRSICSHVTVRLASRR
jgi:acyl-CoA synthetase (AMP-forming)/AMP-acid ligase II